MGMRTSVYVDGFNLYFRALKNTPHRWLDLHELCQQLLGSDFTLHRIRYFTADIRARADDPQKHVRQQVYLRALKTIPCFTIHKGHYLVNQTLMPLANPKPGDPALVEVIKTEEKGSDANLAAYLMLDASQRDFQAAFVITGDSDQAGTIRLVRQEFSYPVHVIDPKDTPSGRLRKAATTYELLDRALLAKCQFPCQLTDRHGTITKPASW